MRRLAWLPLLLLVGGVFACAPVPRPPSVPVPPAPSPTPERPADPAPSPTPEPAGVDPRITVGLIWDADSLTLDPVGRAELDGAARLTLEPSERLSVVLRSDRAEARVLGGAEVRQLALWPGDTLWIGGTEGDAAGPARLVRWNGKSWRGQLKVFMNPRRKLTLASRLPLEVYLLGVIPGEIGPLADDLLEAGRAQAIAARSYTLFYRGRRAAEGFDVYATVEDQLYGPVEAERPLATRCVESTAGEVALFQGSPIRANYHSTCGGITADVWEAWATPPLAYLVSHQDRSNGADHCVASPHHRWREEWTAAEFMANLRQFGPTYSVRLPSGGLGELRDVRATARSRSGRVWRLSVTTSRGEIVVPAYSLRQVLRRSGNAAAILRSNLFKVDVRRDRRTRRALAVVASGAGSGHGVGLCQTGALGMARKGERGERILSHYFPGAVIRKLD